MVEIIDGPIGAGKTYTAVSMMLAHLAGGGVVCTNISLNWSAVADFLERKGVDGESVRKNYIHMRHEEVPQMHRIVPRGTPAMPTLAVIDEVHIWFHSRDSALTAQARRELLTWMSQIRKLGIRVILISQQWHQIDTTFRRLCQTRYFTRRLDNLHLPILGPIIQMPLSLRLTLDAPSDTILKKEVFRREPAVFRCYDSFGLLAPLPLVEHMPAPPRRRKAPRFVMGHGHAWVVAVVTLALVPPPWCWAGLIPFFLTTTTGAMQAQRMAEAREGAPPDHGEHA